MSIDNDGRILDLESLGLTVCAKIGGDASGKTREECRACGLACQLNFVHLSKNSIRLFKTISAFQGIYEASADRAELERQALAVRSARFVDQYRSQFWEE